MPSHDNLRLRLKLLHEFEQLQSRLEAGDGTAVEPATDIFLGVALGRDPGTMALVMKALAAVMDGFQGEVDAKGWRYTVQ